MIPFFPKQISNRAIITYIIALVFISIFFSNYVMGFGYMIFGLLFVIGFFSITNVWSKESQKTSDKRFIGTLFLFAFILRLIWVIFSYFFFIKATGTPFEFDSADALAYHLEAEWLASERWATAWQYYFGKNSIGISDVGYPLYLTVLYKIFGPVIILPRIIKALIGAYTCVLLYRLSSRTIGEDVGRMAGMMMVLMPNFIIYCGYHLKETEMVFLEVAFIERLDYLLRNKKASFVAVFVPTVLAASLFFFRTILGLAAVFSFATVLLLSNTPSMKKGWKRTALIGWGVFCLAILSGGSAMTEIEAVWEQKDDNTSLKRMEQTIRGSRWAQYATGTVMAPMAFILPFSTMIDVDRQYNQQTLHGGNYIRNFMGYFVFLAIIEAFRRKKWRDFVLIGAFGVSYLGVVSLSGFSNSERFLLPGLPCLIVMWAYGVSTLREKTFKYLTPWCFGVFIMEFSWAIFKLGNRGLL